MLDIQLCTILFVTLMGVSIAGVALISLRLKAEGTKPEETVSKLSELKPPEYQSVGFVFLAFIGSLFGLVGTLAYSVLIGIFGSNSILCTVFNTLAWIGVPILVILVLTYLYIGVGHLFSMTLISGQPRGTILGRVPGSKCFTRLAVNIGDIITSDLFPQKGKLSGGQNMLTEKQIDIQMDSLAEKYMQEKIPNATVHDFENLAIAFTYRLSVNLIRSTDKLKWWTIAIAVLTAIVVFATIANIVVAVTQ